MPLVTMATPITTSEIYLLPDPDPIPTRTRIRKWELSFKLLQLALQCFLIGMYSLGTHEVTILTGDPVISAFFGASVMFSLFKIFDVANQSERNKVFLNIMFGVILIIIALILIPLIMMLPDTVLKSEEYDQIIFCINMRLSSAIISLIVGVMCFAEAIYVTLNNVNEI